jgi:hypothetical protein
MTLAKMADRSLPLAERVAAMIRMVADRDPVSDYDIDELLADIAAADRLARAANIYADEEDEYWRSGGEPFELEQMANEEYSAALAAYRARMAQGVGDA